MAEWAESIQRRKPMKSRSNTVVAYPSLPHTKYYVSNKPTMLATDSTTVIIVFALSREFYSGFLEN